MEEIRKKSLRELLPKDELEAAARRGSRKKSEPAEVPPVPPPGRSPVYGELPPADRPNRPARLWLAWIFLIVLLAGAYYLSLRLAIATVRIEPRTATVAIDGEYEAGLAPNSGIEFSVMKLTDSLDKPITAASFKKSQSKAAGTVNIINNFSQASQRLLAGTRFVTANGSLYRLVAAVTVPGQTKSAGKLTPGSISAKITADAIGPQYNSSDLKLTIVGFKGSPKEDKFEVTGSATGGTDGLLPVIKDSDKQAVIKAAETELKEKLIRRARLEIPKDHFFFSDGIGFEVSDQTLAAASSTLIRVSVQLSAILFERKNLSRYLAARSFSDEPTEMISLEDPDALKFKLSGEDKISALPKKISFNLSGQAKFVWPIDSPALSAKLAGLSFGRRDEVFRAFPNVYRAEASIRPPWIRVFPAEQNKISIILSKSGKNPAK
jgi:hypothetical protein